MEQLKIGIGTSSIGRFLPYLAAAAGMFERRGVAVEIVNQMDEEKIVQDIVDGITPVGTPNTPSLLFSLLNGNDLVIVGGILNRPAFFLAADKRISSPDALKGRKVGINQPRRMAGMMMLALLRKWRLNPASDLDLVDLGLNDRSFEALQMGVIDAALLPPEKAFLAESVGFRLIADTLDLNCNWVPLATTRRFLAEHRELVAQIGEIYRESMRLFKADARFGIVVIDRQLPALANKPMVLEKCYRLFAELFEPTLVPELDSLRTILAEVALQDERAKAVDTSKLVDNLT